MNLDNYLLSRKILRLANLDLKRRNAHLKVLDLTSEQSDTLQFVFFHENCPIRELAVFLGVSHQTAQGIVSRMEKKDLLKRIPSSEDRRSVMLRLTEQGHQKMNRIFQNGNVTGSVLTEHMNEKDQAEFLRLLDLAIAGLQENEE